MWLIDAKVTVIEHPVLGAPCMNCLFKLQMDASHVGAVAVLLQTD